MELVQRASGMQLELFLLPSGIAPSELAKTGYTLAAIDLGITWEVLG
jgi:hypothetical protein